MGKNRRCQRVCLNRRRVCRFAGSVGFYPRAARYILYLPTPPPPPPGAHLWAWANSKQDQLAGGKMAINYHESRMSEDHGKNLTVSRQGDAQRDKIEQLYYSPPVLKAFENVCFIAELLKKKDRDDKVCSTNGHKNTEEHLL